MLKNKIRVIIPYCGKIPTIGKGPINNPIYIEEDKFNLLKTLGIPVKEVKDVPTPSKIILPNEEKHMEDNKEEIENIDTINKISEEYKKENNNKEEIEDIKENNEINEKDIEGKLENNIVNEDEETPFEIETATKKQIQKELEKLNIKYDKKMNLNELRALFNNTNN